MGKSLHSRNADIRHKHKTGKLRPDIEAIRWIVRRWRQIHKAIKASEEA
jgi:hypothetical protein